MSSGGEDFSGEFDRLGKVAGHFSEGSDEEVAEVVAAEIAAVTEAVAEEAGDQAFVFGKGDHAVAEVAGRQHVEVAAETSAGASIVGDGNDGCEVGDEGGAGGDRKKAGSVGDAVLEASEEGREAGSSADGYDAQTWRTREMRGWMAHRIGRSTSMYESKPANRAERRQPISG
jgi:hypothetical protein